MPDHSKSPLRLDMIHLPYPDHFMGAVQGSRGGTDQQDIWEMSFGQSGNFKSQRSDACGSDTNKGPSV